MKLRKIILAGAVAILFWQINSFCQSNAPEMNPEIAEMLSTNPPPKSFATRLDYIKSFTSAQNIENAYRSGKISKEEAMLAESINPVSPNDKTPMDTYGEVVDQDGKPVIGAKVQGWLSFEEAEDKEYDTKTDAQGRFKFLDLHGKEFGVSLEKEGYEFNHEIWFADNAKRPDNYLPDPKNPFIFKMWKLRGGEPMSETTIYSDVHWTNNFKRFNLYSDTMEKAGTNINDELMIKAIRGSSFTNRGVQYFAWTVTFEITNGGLFATNDPYPYVAPIEGYQSSVTLDGPTNLVELGRGLHQGFYFKSRGGQIYGRMFIQMMPGRNYASIRLQTYANVTGSRNLEFDSTNWIGTKGQRQMWPLIWPNESGR
jgi:hypothetical protein